jgi:hypothetical protein
MPSAKRKVVLTDMALQALKPAAAGKRYSVWDAALSNFGIKVTDRGVKSFIVVAPMMGKNGKRFAHSVKQLKELGDMLSVYASTADDESGGGTGGQANKRAARSSGQRRSRC